MPFWDECFREIADGYSDITTDQYHIDILTAHLSATRIGLTWLWDRICLEIFSPTWALPSSDPSALLLLRI